MCMIRLQRHIGGGARIGPASDWPVEREVELELELLLADDVVGGVPVELHSRKKQKTVEWITKAALFKTINN